MTTSSCNVFTASLSDALRLKSSKCMLGVGILYALLSKPVVLHEGCAWCACACGITTAECGGDSSFSVLLLRLLFSTMIGEAVGEVAGCFLEQECSVGLVNSPVVESL